MVGCVSQADTTACSGCLPVRDRSLTKSGTCHRHVATASVTQMMTHPTPPKTPARLDLVGKRILRGLAEHVVVDTAALARDLGASEPAVRDRLRAMQEAGLVQGFQVRVDARQLGESFEYLVTGVPTERTDRAALARLCADPQVTRVLGLASSHSIAFTVVGRDLATTRAHGLSLAEKAGLRQPQAAMVLTTFEDRAGALPPAVGIAEADPAATLAAVEA